MPTGPSESLHSVLHENKMQILGASNQPATSRREYGFLEGLCSLSCMQAKACVQKYRVGDLIA